MNEVIKTINNHRTTRNFVKGEKISNDELNAIIQAAKRAPSWMNGQHYSIIVVDDENLKEKISELVPNNKHIENSSAFLLFIADSSSMKVASEIEGEQFTITDSFEDLLAPVVDASLAMQNAVVVAESLGYGTVCCGGVRGAGLELIELFKLPEHSFVLCGLSIGKVDETIPVEKIKPRFEDEVNVGYNAYPLTTKEHIEKYNKTMSDFAEARETKIWSKKFADYYKAKARENITKEVLAKQKFISKK